MASTIAALRTALATRGLDLVAPLSVQAYNVAAPTYLAPTMGRADTLALVVGSTRALWPLFLAAYRASPLLQTSAHPLDDYCADAIGEQLAQTLAAHAPVPRYETFWATEPPPRRILLQRAAVAAGLAYLAPSHLCIHPTYGPWFSLRALIVLDAPGPGHGGVAAPRPCAPTCCCADNCQPHIDRLAQLTHSQAGVHATWRDYLALRDACPVGRSHRFSEAQLRYHYTHQRDALAP